MKNAKATIADIEALRGILKKEPGEKPLTQELLEERAEDLKREEEMFKQAE